MPLRTQVALLPPAVQGSFIELVRSKMTMMWAGFGTPWPMAAVALALMLKWSIPMSFPKMVGTFAAFSVTTMAFDGLQLPTEAMHFVVTEVATPGMLSCVFLPPDPPP